MEGLTPIFQKNGAISLQLQWWNVHYYKSQRGGGRGWGAVGLIVAAATSADAIYRDTIAQRCCMITDATVLQLRLCDTE